MRIICLVTLAVLSGCSSQPQTATTAAPLPAVRTAAAEKAAMAPAEKVAAASEYTPPIGYKKRVEDGRTYYCSKITVLGSRFPKEDCRTQTELEDMELRKSTTRQEIQQRINVCGSVTGCGSP